jgi:hypothetical protein
VADCFVVWQNEAILSFNRFALLWFRYLRSTWYRRKARCLGYPKEAQYDEYDDDHDQDVNPTAGARESWAYVPSQETEQPQDK